MRKLLYIFCLIPLFISCVDEEEFADTPQGNMEALWKIIDEHYCFLDYKQQEYGLDWDAVHQKYKERVKGQLTRKQQFDNFSDTLIRRYMGTDYQIASGISYKILDDNIGYIRYESFSDPIGEGNLNEALSHMILCRGLIIDIRSNGGGMLTNAEKLAARFCQEKTLVGYYQHKTGPGHQDFSDKEARYLEPSANVRWNKPAVVLTNRRVYSAANEFAVYMKTLPNVRLVGDHTGGGAGMPFSSSLPCGWSVRFSAVPMYDAQGESAEFGIEPDYNVQQTDEDFAKGKDTLIEFARQLLVQ